MGSGKRKENGNMELYSPDKRVSFLLAYVYWNVRMFECLEGRGESVNLVFNQGEPGGDLR